MNGNTAFTLIMLALIALWAWEAWLDHNHRKNNRAE